MTHIGNYLTPQTAVDTDLSLQKLEAQKVKNLSKQEFRDAKQLEKATNGFEALLLHEMLKSLWSTVEVKGWLGGEETNEAKIYRDMLNQALADSIAEGKGVGIKDIVRKELTQNNSYRPK